jgi:hypothetical protein
MASLLCSLSLLLCLASAGALSAPPETHQQDANHLFGDLDPGPFTEAIPSRDFTLFNVSSTVEQVFADAQILSQPGSEIQKSSNTRSKRSSCACTTTIGAYGGREGTAFVDVPTNPCDVKISDIWVCHAAIVDGIQVQYNYSDGSQQMAPLRGARGGQSIHISVPQNGKVVGLFGGIARITYGLVISQLRILVMDDEGRLQIYGPFGTQLHIDPSTFAVHGDIKSLFGYHRHYLDGLGVFYEPWGECGSPCAQRGN